MEPALTAERTRCVISFAVVPGCQSVGSTVQSTTRCPSAAAICTTRGELAPPGGTEQARADAETAKVWSPSAISSRISRAGS